MSTWVIPAATVIGHCVTKNPFLTNRIGESTASIILHPSVLFQVIYSRYKWGFAFVYVINRQTDNESPLLVSPSHQPLPTTPITNAIVVEQPLVTGFTLPSLQLLIRCVSLIRRCFNVETRSGVHGVRPARKRLGLAIHVA